MNKNMMRRYLATLIAMICTIACAVPSAIASDTP
ncbi:hypothetical protein F7D09_0101 [Bifidobacterium leontopitheci]|uniref:Uncharacterized protein n=1 Tax=Bifidobacterium leontopitheci TaxID=2650774 RepID=A0A6I1GPJ0_9BIFI|nr:hypothetical protein F7D09_0101 [Bifidobacterium leontopitheci]